MRMIIQGGTRDGEVIDLGTVYRYGDPQWVDPEAPDFDQRRQVGVTYQLRPLARLITEQRTGDGAGE